MYNRNLNNKGVSMKLPQRCSGLFATGQTAPVNYSRSDTYTSKLAEDIQSVEDLLLLYDDQDINMRISA